MSIDDLRHEMTAFRQHAEHEAMALKDTTVVLERLRDFYRGLDEEGRGLAKRIISEWVQSEDEAVRFDAIFLVGEFGISEVLPALRALGSRLSRSAHPGAPYELRKIHRLMDRLSSAQLP